MIFSENPHVLRPSSPASDDVAVATLRAVTYRSRAILVPLVTEAFQECGCWTRERSGTAASLHLRFEMPLHAVSELYSRVIECGLEFDRRGHCELALLCTLRRHAIVPQALRRTLDVRLEITFADELEPATLSMAGAGA